MRSFLSERAKNTGKSSIREILEVSKKPGVISFAGGLPKPETFPFEDLAEAARRQIGENYRQSLQYGMTEGVIEFRKEMIDWLSNFGWSIELDNIIATNSSQQALDLVSKAFLDPGDVLFCGLPTYAGAIQSFQLFQARSVGVPMESDGMNLNVLEEEIRRVERTGRQAKFVYVIPDFQNPTGVTMSGRKRKKLVKIAMEYDLLIIEDTPYFGLRFEGQEERPINAYDDEGRVITMSSLSKVLSAGMRLAVVVGPENLIDALVTVKQATDLCTSTTTQWIALEWMQNHELSEHLAQARRHYRQNRNVILEALERFFPDDERITWTRPEGGLFIWVTLPEGVNTDELLFDALENKVAFVPGSGFYVNDGGKNSMRLCYSVLQPDEINKGIKLLAEVVRRHLSAASPAREE